MDSNNPSDLSSPARRFVVLEHRQRDGVHWDLMLETAGVLATWQVSAPPEQWGPDPILCERIFDHRLQYLTYEGPVSGGRGQVRRVEQGMFEVMRESDSRWDVRLIGQVLQGPVGLARIDGDTWRLEWG